MNEIVRFFLDPIAFTLLGYRYILINASSIILSCEHQTGKSNFPNCKQILFGLLGWFFDYRVWCSYKNTTMDIRS